MSLNGLDDVKVKEAHEAAAAEPGGWFLLKYSARDEVELLGKGNGGIVEIRNAIAAYEEPTPLFGFLRYRRRNVVIKYVPEECSRLVQARVAVHFNAVTERFNPHDTTFSITTSRELKDSTLSAACSLHTASGSTSSSTSSLRRRRLMEITEDEEEDNRAKRQSTVPEERATLAKPFDAPVSTLPPLHISLPDALASGLPPPSTDYRAMIADLETSPPPPRETVILDIRPKSPTKSIDERRKSSQSTRPDLHSYSSYGSTGKPKIKLGPRPSLDVGGRPHTSASGSASHFRPVSSLPAGLKLSKTPSKREHRDRPHTQHAHTQEPPSMTISPPPIPEDTPFSSQRPHTSGGRPTTSSGVSIRPPPSPSAMSTKFPHMTPEKVRLMKALEMRKRKETQAAANAQDALLQASVQTLEERPVSAAPSKEVQDTLQMLNDMAETADSGATFDARSTLKTDESDATRSDSSPVSPVGASEHAESTRASSVSGSTDETIQEHILPKSDTKSDTSAPEDNQDERVSTEAGSSQRVEEETEPIPTSVVEEKKAEDLYMLLPHIYTPPIRSPTSETKSYIEEAGPANYGLAPLDVVTHKSADNPLTEADHHEPELSEPVQCEEAENEEDTVVDESSEIHTAAPPVPVKEWKIPRSKFSRENFQADNVTPEVPSEALPSTRYERRAEAPEKSPVESTFSAKSKNSLSNKQKRRAMVEPIRTDGLTDQSASDAHFSSDEDFMDELQSAVVQEALPVSVKSPTGSEFPSPKNPKSNRFSRTFSNPLRKDKGDSKMLGALNSPQIDGRRSVSAGAAYLNKINQQDDSRPVAKKVNLGSGISQRIKALEKLSSASPAASLPNATVTTAVSSSSFFSSIRKGSVRESSSTPSVAERANSLSRNTPPPSASRESSPEVSKFRDRSGSVKSRAEVFRSSPTPLAKAHMAKPESISVNARIVRDHDLFPAKPEIGKELSDFKPLELRESPLVISHQRAGVDPPKETIQERRLSRESSTSAPKNHARERRSSITVIKDFISDMSEGRTSFSDRRRSMNLEVSTTKSPTKSPSRPPSTHTTRPMSIGSRLSFSSITAPSPSPTAGSSSSNNEEKPEKKQSRSSRIKKRMSNFTTGRKANTHAMSPTVREELEPPNFSNSGSPASPLPSQGSMAPTPTLNSLGEVNVQFPDSLLWKRRAMALDSQGNLILTASGNSKDKKGGSGASRRFHFSEFRVPAIPDIEIQELPNSVVLDFVDGGGLQIACEDRAGQGSLLKVLQDAHRVWAAYGQ